MSIAFIVYQALHSNLGLHTVLWVVEFEEDIEVLEMREAATGLVILGFSIGIRTLLFHLGIHTFYGNMLYGE